MALTDFKRTERPRTRNKRLQDFYNHFTKEKDKNERRDTCNESTECDY